jgi:SAM-dependent methyltransferase
VTDEDRIRWDERYRTKGPAPLDGVCPPPAFAPYEDLFPVSGHALDLACGQGLHAVWLARRGLAVCGFDVSPVAIGHAQELARQARVEDRCHFSVVDLDHGFPAGQRVNVVLCHKFRDRRLDRAIIERLVPGGLLALTALSVVSPGRGRFRTTPDELRAAFAELELIDAGEAEGEVWLLARA